ncbi:MAG: MFS transporter [Verrucomicrobiota bacterium]
MSTESSSRATFPPGLHNAYLFAVFNALSFQVVLGSPMVLYAKTLNASATVLGIIAGMMPLLVIFQIPAAHYVARVGYKRFVFAGWGTRVMFIFAMALVPFTGGFLDAGTRLALILMLLFGFNLSRGISSSAWLPWIAGLVPEAVRGRYLARDAACVSVASVACALLAAFCLGTNPSPWQFAVLFGFSGLAGAASLNFLKRMPDVPVPEEDRQSKTQVPWLEMSRHQPFRRLLWEAMAWAVVYGGIQAFTVAFLKSETALAEGQILFLSAVFYCGGLGSLWFLGSRLDSLGSKPVLSFSFLIWLVLLAGWVALAGGYFKATWSLLLGLHFFMGLFSALVQMSNTRLAMAVSPVMGRSHFFAIYSVTTSLALGTAPVGWGMLIDALGQRDYLWLNLHWTRFTLFFAAIAVVMFIALILSRRLEEPKAVNMEALLREILIQSPQRVWFRLWPRG